jgi:histidinol dehydrogenase
MIKIYSVDEAEKTILRREMALQPTVPPKLQASLDRLFGKGSRPETAVSHLLSEIRQRGDAALRHWTEQIDGVALGAIRLEPAAIAAAAQRVEPELLDALRLAADRVREFHQHQPLPSWETTALGGRLGQKVTPLRRVGVYVPGGTAPLPSSLLMSVIPAQVAGVREIVVATPPQRETGQIADVILAAAHICGVDTIYQMGGAQAIGALAFGTESVARVDKIVGPGGLFVTLAKRQVYGMVGIDGLYGPTETAVIADDSANPAWVAADLLAQAEHDVLATAILFTPSRALATAVQAEIARQTEQLSRDDVIAISLANQSGIVITQDLAEAARLADGFAPEHLCIVTENPRHWAEQIQCAGGIFLGERSFEVLGDYVAGPSHVMPTGGTARFASPLTAVDFVRITSIIELDDATSARLSPTAARIAQAELLTAHANAARLREGI